MKKCSMCKEEKQFSEFGINRASKDGRTYACKKCRNRKQMERLNDPELGPARREGKRRATARWNKKHYNTEEYRGYALKKMYGLTVEEWDELYKAQDGRCAICGKHKPKTGGRKGLAVDHCHNSKKVRGLLCSNCNTGIGLLAENPELFKKAMCYIENGGFG